MSIEKIEKLYQEIQESLFFTTGNKSYSEITDCIIELCNMISSDDCINGEDIVYIGEFSQCSLDDFIVGAYWHYTEWHGGQYSKGYKALSCLGDIFNPGMSSVPEPASGEYITYESLNAEAVLDQNKR